MNTPKDLPGEPVPKHLEKRFVLFFHLDPVSGENEEEYVYPVRAVEKGIYIHGHGKPFVIPTPEWAKTPEEKAGAVLMSLGQEVQRTE